MTEAVLLHAVVPGSSSRLESGGMAAYLDSLVAKHSQYAGINLDQDTTGVVSTSNAGFVDAAALQPLKDTFASFVKSQRDACNEYLGEGSIGDGIDSATAEADEKLQKLEDELGKRFMSGVASAFSKEQTRSYDSFWNWVKQDAIELHGYMKKLIANGSPPSHLATPHTKLFAAIAKWVVDAVKDNTESPPPQILKKNFLCNRATENLLDLCKFNAKAGEMPGYAQAIACCAKMYKSGSTNHLCT